MIKNKRIKIANTYSCSIRPGDIIQVSKGGSSGNVVLMMQNIHSDVISTHLSPEDAEALMLSIAVILKQAREERES